MLKWTYYTKHCIETLLTMNLEAETRVTNSTCNVLAPCRNRNGIKIKHVCSENKITDILRLLDKIKEVFSANEITLLGIFT